MNLLLPTETLELGDKTLTIRCLNFDESLKVYGKLQRLIAGFMDESAVGGLPVFQMAGMAGQLPSDDLEMYIKVFGETTTCRFADGRELLLKKIPKSKNGEEINPMDEVFAGALDELFVWLDKCVQVNFGSLIAKTRAGLESVVPAKAEPKA
jgi:hypothetical protein